MLKIEVFLVYSIELKNISLKKKKKSEINIPT